MSSDFWFPPNPKSDTTYFNEHRANENMYCFLQKKYYALTWNVPPWLTHLINNFWNQPLFTSFFLFIEIWEYFFTKYSFSAPVMFDSISFSVNLTNEHLGNKKRTTWARINRSINWFVRAVWTLSPAFERHSNLSIHEQRPISFKVQQIHESPSIEFVNWWPVHLNNWLKTDNLIRAPYMGNSAEVLGG